ERIFYVAEAFRRGVTVDVVVVLRDKIHLNCGASRVARTSDAVRVTDTQGNTAQYDHVIFACHSDQALALIDTPTRAEKEVLGNIHYQPNRVVLHSDTSFMPIRKAAWSSWVYLCDGHNDKEPVISLSYWMNNLQPLDTDHPIIVTLNPGREPAPHLVHNDHMFAHPIFDQSAIAAQQRIGEIQGSDRLWFCGAWQRYGFHEDGLSSAVTLAQRLGATIPWAS
ncbi:MAG: FAD-dependent oxidoreductase, partial [Pseudomonadota bacterium]